MGKIVDIQLPKLGESIVSARVVQWLKKKGDKVSLDEPLLEVSTDKVNSEIPSPVEGILEEVLVKEDEEIEVGGLLARINLTAPSEATATSTSVETPHTSSSPAPNEKSNTFLSPGLLREAEAHNISLDTLKTLQGTGEGGRVTKKDLLDFVEKRKKNEKPSSPCKIAASREIPSSNALEERVKLSGMRKAIADNMVRSFYEAPHASLVAEVDVTEIMQMIRKEKERFLEAHGVKLTITSFLIYALSKALQQFPLLNASLENDTIVMKRYINTGIAVNIDKGLVVPVIKNCQERNLVSIAKEVASLAHRARSHQLNPDEVREGTITLTNFGMTGALIGVPIIRYPEVAIIGAGTVQKRVVVREDDSFAVRQMLYLTLTFDHRVIDGIYGCEFLQCFKQNIESFVMQQS